MKYSLIFLLAVAFPALALTGTYSEKEGMERKNGEIIEHIAMSITVTDEPCTDEDVLVHLRKRFDKNVLHYFRRSILVWKGETYESCYFDDGERVLSIDTDGVPLLPPIPVEMFDKKGGVGL